jgi:hypothetical protein
MTARNGRLSLPFLGYLLLQELIVVGLATPEYPDSAGYKQLSLTGHDLRLPTVPLLYKILPTDDLRIAAQVVLAAASWWILASVASGLVRDRRIALALRAVILVLGLLGPVASWNSAILSESVALSLTALLVAAWLRYGREETLQSAALVLVATLFWTFTRQPHVVIDVLVTAAAVVAAMLAATDQRRIRILLAAGLACITVAGFIEIQNNQAVSDANIGAMIQKRMLTNLSRTEWLVRHGMPYDRTIASYAGKPFHHYGSDNAEFVAWLHDHGQRIYLEFMLAHPDYTLLDPLPYFSGERDSIRHPNETLFGALQPNPTPSLLSPTVNYARHRDVLPTVVQQLFWDQGQIGDVLVLAGFAFGLAYLVSKRWGFDRRFLLPLLVAVLAMPQGYVVWLGGGEAVGELDRLSMVTAASVRIGLWLLLAFAADRYVTERRGRNA